jgi:hypothetical protein
MKSNSKRERIVSFDQFQEELQATWRSKARALRIRRERAIKEATRSSRYVVRNV